MNEISGLGKIGVLMGGPSTEREISLKSGRAVYEALTEAGIDVVVVDITTDNIEDNVRLIELQDIDCAFIALHGRFGEDGQIQKILDQLDIPYTGSGVLASKLALDKLVSRGIFTAAGLDIPRYKTVNRFNQHLLNIACLGFPLVVKPNTQGSSIGLARVDKKEDFEKALDMAFSFDDTVLIDEFVPGREVTVGILAENALPIVEIVHRKQLFDYEAKYNLGMTDYIVPAELTDEVSDRVRQKAIIAHKALGCFGFSRVDIILKDDWTPVILEVNSIPGFTRTSLLPKAAKAAGINFIQLCIKLIELAYEKTQIKSVC